MRVLILGGTRFLGRRVTERLVAAGDDVVVAQRGVTGRTPPDGARALALDRSTGAGLDAVRALRPQAVVDLSAYEARWVAEALEALPAAPHYVFVSSGAVYRPSPELPWPETTPYGPQAIWGAYGREKLAAERLLRTAHDEGRVGATIVRFPYVMGPDNYADRESFVCSRIRAGRPILLCDGGLALNQHVHVDDAAEAIVAMVRAPDRSRGEAFNCGYERAVTNRGLVALCAEALGEAAEIVSIDADALGVAAPTVDLADVVFPLPEVHYVLDATRLRERLGVRPRRDNRTIVADFLAGWAPEAPRSYPREERALAALGR